MKTEFDKEIDALLRRGAHAAGRAARGRLAGAAAAHLDADELSAFAENALPAPARASAASHLADCDECRGLVVRLAGSANVAVEHERGAAAKAASKSEGRASVGGWLSALFAPRVLRFAAPALALCLVGTVAYVVMRSGLEGGRQVAQSDVERTSAPRTGITDANASAANMNANTAADAAAGNVNQEPTNGATGNFTIGAQGENREQPALKDEGQAREPQQPDGSDTEPAAPPRPVTETVEVTSGAAPAPVALAPAAAAPPPPAPAAPQEAAKAAREDAPTRSRAGDDETVRVDNNSTQDRAGRQAGNLENVQAPDDSRRSRNYPSAVGARSSTAAPPPRNESEREPRALSRGASARRSTRDADRAEERKKEAAESNAAETRSAGGHRFRREGNVWVDVNYRSSMSMTGVRRGTDQYRALVADVPEVGRVAEQISGAVVVVVRGRAYRVQ